MKKCRRGKGMRLTAVLRRSALSWPGKRMHAVVPHMAAEMRWLRSPYVGCGSLRVRKQMSYRASLSRTYLREREAGRGELSRSGSGGA